jgi:immune inhibitor A
VGEHPGHGELLLVDARPEFDHYPSTGPELVNPVKLGYDSPFSLQPSDDLHLHYLTQPYTLEGQGASPVFNDLVDWWFMNDEHTTEGQHPGHNQPGWSSVDAPDFGVKIKVLRVADNGDMRIKVGSTG